MDNFRLLKDVFFKRIIIIMLVGLVGAFLAGIEKYQTKDVQIQSGSVVVVSEVQFIDPDEKTDAYPFQYDTFIKSVGTVCKLVYRLEEADDINIDAVNSDWKKMSVEKKYMWMDKHVFVDFFGDGKCQLSMYLDVNTPKEAEACGEQGKNFLKKYLETSFEEMKTVKPNLQMDIKSMDEYKPQVVTVSQKNLVYKYAAIGFVLGMMLAAIACFIAASRKR